MCAVRILTVGNMYPPHHLGGYELTWQSSVDHLRRAGHDVRVLTTDYRRDGAGPDEPGVHRELRWYWRDHDFPRTSLRARRAIERHAIATLERHLREFEPGAIAWWAMGGLPLSLLEHARGLPQVGVVGDDWMLYAPKVDAWHRLASRLRPRRVGLDEPLWLFNSEAVCERALASGWDLPRTAVAHPGVDEELFAPAPEHEWEWRLLYVGRIDPRKGVGTAIEALSRMPEATLRVLGAGDEDHLSELRGMSAGRVDFGELRREQLPAAYAEADVLVFPVKWEEPWGIVPLEAMAVGTPVVATGTGGSGEYLRDGENCLLFPRGDSDALAKAVRRLADHPALRARLREGGFDTARRYTARAYDEAIEAALVAQAGSEAGTIRAWQPA
jgi:glycosyltransferase involved in cell wall biosynthesis